MQEVNATAESQSGWLRIKRFASSTHRIHLYLGDWGFVVPGVKVESLEAIKLAEQILKWPHLTENTNLFLKYQFRKSLDKLHEIQQAASSGRERKNLISRVFT